MRHSVRRARCNTRLLSTHDTGTQTHRYTDTQTHSRSHSHTATQPHTLISPSPSIAGTSASDGQPCRAARRAGGTPGCPCLPAQQQQQQRVRWQGAPAPHAARSHRHGVLTCARLSATTRLNSLWNLAAWHQRRGRCAGARWGHARFKRAGRREGGLAVSERAAKHPHHTHAANTARNTSGGRWRAPPLGVTHFCMVSLTIESISTWEDTPQWSAGRGRQATRARVRRVPWNNGSPWAGRVRAGRRLLH